MTPRPETSRTLRRARPTACTALVAGFLFAPLAAAGQIDGESIAALELRGPTSGIIVGVVQEGELAALETFGAPVFDDDAGLLDPEAIFPFPWGTQMLIGVTARALANAGLVDLDRPISTWLPELGGSGVGEATLDDLLRGRAGLPDVLPPPGVGWGPLLDAAGRIETVAPAGAAYSRSRLSYPLAARVLERVVGVPFNELAGTAVLVPLGMEHSSFSPTVAVEQGQLMQGYEEDADGTVRPVPHLLDASGLPVLYTSVPDLLTLATAWMGGALQGADPLLPIPEPDLLGGRHFADGLWMEPNRSLPRSWSSDEGLGFGAFVALYPATRTAAVVVSNGRLATGLASWALAEVEAMLEGGSATGEGLPVDALPSEGPGTTADAAPAGAEPTGEPATPPADVIDWAGRYRNGSLALTLEVTDAGIPVLVDGEARAELAFAGDDTWVLPEAGGQIVLRFVRVAGAPAIFTQGVIYGRVAEG